MGLAIVLVVGLLAGWLAGIGRPSGERTLMGLATANRNIAAALVVATSIGGDTIVYTLVGALTIPWCSSCWPARSGSERQRAGRGGSCTGARPPVTHSLA